MGGGELKRKFFISVFQQADGAVMTLGAAQTRTSVFEEGGKRDCKSRFVRYMGRVCVWLYKNFFCFVFFTCSYHQSINVLYYLRKLGCILFFFKFFLLYMYTVINLLLSYLVCFFFVFFYFP